MKRFSAKKGSSTKKEYDALVNEFGIQKQEKKDKNSN